MPYFNPNKQMDMFNVKPNNEGNGGFGPTNGNGSFLESSGSTISPDNDGHSDSLSIMRIPELNANFGGGNVNPGPNTGRHSFITNANMLSPGGDLMQINGNSAPLSLVTSTNILSSGNLSGLITNDSPVSQWKLKKRQKVRKIAGSSSLVGLRSSHYNQLSLPFGMNQEPSNLPQLFKKPRIDARPHMLQRHIAHQLLQGGRVPNQFQDYGPQLRMLMEHYGQQNQLDGQALSPFPQLSGVQGRPVEEKVGQHIERQGICPATCMQWVDKDVCSRQLAKYLNNLQNRPKDNHIDFWRNFVSEFYAPSAKERWCFSSYKNLGQRATSVLTHGTTEAKRCDSCGSTSVKGFEASFEVLPRLWKLKYENGVVEETLRLDCPQECRYPSGIMLLKYDKVVQESVYDQSHVIREGKLRITFRQDLKILSWDFCATRHEEYLLRQRVQIQVNQLLDAAYKYRGALKHRTIRNDTNGDIQANSNLFLKAENELARTIKLPIVDELGFSKGYVRWLQVAGVVDMMKDLITFSMDRKIGAIESLHTYVLGSTPRETQASVLTEEPQETTQEESIQYGLNGGNKLMAKHVGIESIFGDTVSTGNMVFPDAGEREMGSRASYYQRILGEDNFNPLESDMRPDQLFWMNCSREAMSSSIPAHPYPNGPNPAQSCDPWYTQMVREESSEAHQHNQQQHFSEKIFQEEARLKSIKNAFGKQNVHVVDTDGNIIPGLPTGYGGRSIIRDGPNFGKPTPGIKEASPFIDAKNSWKKFTRNPDKVQGSSMTVKKESDNQESYLPASSRGKQKRF